MATDAGVVARRALAAGIPIRRFGATDGKVVGVADERLYGSRIWPGVDLPARLHGRIE